MAPEGTIATHAGNVIAGDDLSADNPGTRAEVAQDCKHVTVIWIEPLAWHANYGATGYETLLADDGYFTAAAGAEFADFMTGHLAGPDWNVPGADITHDDSEEWDDEPSVAISCRIPLPNGPQTTMEEFSDLTWPFVAAMTNVTDPGTFGCEYIMSALADRFASKYVLQAA